MAYAVIRTGGKQYRVAPGELVHVEKLEAEKGMTIALGEVLMTSDGEEIRIGSPLLEGVSVTARVVDQDKAKKILVFHKKRRKGEMKRQGHRQPVTTLQVLEISGMKKPSGAESSGSES